MPTIARLPEIAFRRVEISQIDIDEPDLRSDAETDEDLQGLADTQKGVGELQPVLLSYNSQSRRYTALVGRRRIRGMQLNGQKMISAGIMDDVTDGQALVVQLIENLQRRSLKPLDEARGMAELRDQYNFPEPAIANLLGLSSTLVEERLSLLQLPDSVKRLVDCNALGVGHAVCLTQLCGRVKTQVELADRVVDESLPVNILERIVDEAQQPVTGRRKRRKRRHWIRRSGAPLSENLMNTVIQQLVIRGEGLLNFLNAIPLERWYPAKAKMLAEAITAIEQGLAKVKRKAERRGRQKQ